jgi:hypothetical protein
MSSVLYYSNYCDKCKALLTRLSKSPQSKDIHFICIDKRIKKPNGGIYVILPNGNEILLPPNVSRVPALLLLNKNNHVLFGNDINNYLQPREAELENKATMGNGEPMAFSFGSAGSSWGVMSDQYSYWDMEAESLTAKGDGGLRQMHFYASVNHADNIEAPNEEYSPNKMDDAELEIYKRSREAQDTATKNIIQRQL